MSSHSHVLVRAMILLHQGEFYKMVINESIELGYLNNKYYYIDDFFLETDIDGEEILPYLSVLSNTDIYSLVIVPKNGSSSTLLSHTESCPTPAPSKQCQEYTFCI